MSKKKFTLLDLADEQIEECFDGSSDTTLVRSLLIRHWLAEGNIVNVEGFGQDFAEAIAGFIDADEANEPDEWQEAYDNNQEWGETIAINCSSSDLI